ncbi:MAG: nitroreductase [Saprospiraceae bacterium]|jgi:nitroreductase|nr:nitroreductase [Saprospiraceae bacterium]MBP9209004.1 nitroreductase [Saprospiraceae bacterium]MBV6472759.1 Coenzyme F420:L-glutamate ligase [Saprospiraceae bacterium]
MDESFSILTDIIRRRRSEYPATYQKGSIDEELIRAVLENACWAPNHKRTEPWRFVVIRGSARESLSQQMRDHFRQQAGDAEPDPVRLRQAGERPLQADTIVAICIHRSPAEAIPAWEETAAVACAVQNMWLSCTALGIGAYWASPSVIGSLGKFLGLADGEECLGLFYMGWSGQPGPERSRNPLDAVCRWL